MIASLSSSPALILIATTILAGIILFLLVSRQQSPTTGQLQADDSSAANVAVSSAPPAKSKQSRKAPPDKAVPFSHSWLMTSLKSHAANVLSFDYSTNRKFFISCAEDRTILIWNTKDLHSKDHKVFRVNVEFDHATLVKWSPDTRAFVIVKANGNILEIFRLNRKTDGTVAGVQAACTYSKKHEKDIVALGIASTGKFIMTASSGTDVLIWDLKGEVLHTIDTHQVYTTCALVSPCGRFVATSGFTPDVKVWQVVFTKTGEYKDVSRAFELKGHHAGVLSFDFNDDSTRMVTISKDRNWRLWDTNVEYNLGQDPSLLRSGNIELSVNATTHIALSPDGHSVALANGSRLCVWGANTEDPPAQWIEDIHSVPVSQISFDPTSRYLMTSGDRHIRVFHNVPGYRENIVELKSKMKQASNASMRERIEEQIDESRKALDRILGKGEV